MESVACEKKSKKLFLAGEYPAPHFLFMKKTDIEDKEQVNLIPFESREEKLRREQQPAIVPSVLFDEDTVEKMNWKAVFSF